MALSPSQLAKDDEAAHTTPMSARSMRACAASERLISMDPNASREASRESSPKKFSSPHGVIQPPSLLKPHVHQPALSGRVPTSQSTSNTPHHPGKTVKKTHTSLSAANTPSMKASPALLSRDWRSKAPSDKDGSISFASMASSSGRRTHQLRHSGTLSATSSPRVSQTGGSDTFLLSNYSVGMGLARSETPPVHRSQTPPVRGEARRKHRNRHKHSQRVPAGTHGGADDLVWLGSRHGAPRSGSGRRRGKGSTSQPGSHTTSPAGTPRGSTPGRRLTKSPAFDGEFRVTAKTVANLARTPHGSRYLQNKMLELQESGDEQKYRDYISVLVEGSTSNLPRLMTDTYGNYLIQRLLQAADDDQRYEMLLKVHTQLPTISCDKHGTRAAQKLVGQAASTSREQILVVEGLLPGHKDPSGPHDAGRAKLLNLMTNPNGSHVVQAVLQYFNPSRVAPIVEMSLLTAQKLSTDANGLCVLKKALELAVATPRQFLNCSMSIMEEVQTFVRHQYGNYLIQHIIEVLKRPGPGGPLADKPCPGHENEKMGRVIFAKLHQGLEGSYVELSKQKYSSNVIEKCLKLGDGPLRGNILKELLDERKMRSVLEDSYGNYVMQNVLQVASPQQNALIRECIRPFANKLRPNVRKKWDILLSASRGNEHSSGWRKGSKLPPAASRTSPMKLRTLADQEVASHTQGMDEKEPGFRELSAMRSLYSQTPGPEMMFRNLNLQAGDPRESGHQGMVSPLNPYAGLVSPLTTSVSQLTPHSNNFPFKDSRIIGSSDQPGYNDSGLSLNPRRVWSEDVHGQNQLSQPRRNSVGSVPPGLGFSSNGGSTEPVVSLVGTASAPYNRKGSGSRKSSSGSRNNSRPGSRRNSSVSKQTPSR